jgi:hypothetical protein
MGMNYNELYDLIGGADTKNIKKLFEEHDNILAGLVCDLSVESKNAWSIFQWLYKECFKEDETVFWDWYLEQEKNVEDEGFYKLAIAYFKEKKKDFKKKVKK